MLRLYVMRHAKSSWAVPGARDFDRELNDRGLFDLEKISRILAARKYIPEQVLCSPAARTRATLEGIKSVFPETVDLEFPSSLYSSGLNEYVELIQEKGSAQSLMVIGHNPMCGALAASMPKEDSDFPLETIAYRYPTGAVAVIDFQVDSWSEVEKRTGNLVDCIIPREL